MSSKTRLYVSGSVVATKTRFGSHSPVSHDLTSVTLPPPLRSRFVVSAGLAGSDHLRASPAAHHWRRGHGVGALLVASLGGGGGRGGSWSTLHR